MSATGASSPGTQQNSCAKNKKLFPQKLWDLINDDRYNFCLRWSDDGQLVYLNRDEFEDSYLKTAENQFHTQKAISFVRQMNMYGFRKVDDCYYENDNFKRDCEHLLKNMIRKHPNKNTNAYNEVSPFLYQRGQHNSDTVQIAQSSAAQSTLLAPSTINTKLIDCRQRLCYPLHEQTKLYDNVIENERANQVCHKLQDNFVYNQQQNNEDDRFTDDSLSSSFDDYCCNATSRQAEAIATVIDHLESNNNNEILDYTDSKKSQQQQNLNSINKLGSNIFDSFHIPQNGVNSSPIGETSGANQLASDVKDNSILDPFSLDNCGVNFKGATNDVFDEETNMQHQNFASHYNDQRELIKALIMQQSNAKFPSRDLNSHFKNLVQPDNSLNAFYALLSSINTGLCQSTLPLQTNPHQNLNYDCTRVLNLQQLYQHILLQQPDKQQTQVSIDQGNHVSNARFQRFARDPDGSTMTNSVALDKDSSPTSILLKSKLTTSTSRGTINNVETIENGQITTDNQLNGRSDGNSISKFNRSFKRSVDSILDSNNNSDKASDSLKKIKLEEESTNGERVISKVINKNAKNLVTQIAFARDAKVDADVIYEASKYTERFVETLFDTAQVIARHSNGSSSSDSNQVNDSFSNEEEKDLRNNDNEVDRSFINLSDLTSALRLLPSKIIKILK